MCGIVAYNGHDDQLVEILLDGLAGLEYRGYDSAGISVIANGSIYVKKTVGKVAALTKAIRSDAPTHIGHVGIAHTRWATHGGATASNAHPQSSADGMIWVVHNGIIENYRQLKDELVAKGITFESETDTEVVAKLIGDLYRGDLLAAVAGACVRLQGAFALCVMCRNEPERLVGVKQASPLIVGVGTDEIVIASDVSAIVKETKSVIYLNDGELVDVQNGSYMIHDFTGAARTEPIITVDWNIEAATKAGFDHYLLKEIMEQPAAIAETLRGRVLPNSAGVRFGEFIDIQARAIRINRVVLVGIGTSYYAAKLGELYFNALTNIPSVAVMSPEYRYSQNPIDAQTWVIAVSQSGETADTIAAMEQAKRRGALVTSIANVVGSTVARTSDAAVYNHIGPEISVASTKAFSSQALLMLMHALWLSRLHRYDSAQVAAILEAVRNLESDVSRVLADRKKIEAVAESLTNYHNLLYIGRQYNYPIALEGALKIKEIAYVHAEGLSGGELKHGFIALIDHRMPTIAIATTDAVTDKMLTNIEEIKARRGKVIAVAHRPHELFDATIMVPASSSDLLQPLVNNVALQLLAYYSAKNRGRDIDQPRNLAKSVTVE